METNTNCVKGLDFEKDIEKRLKSNNIPFLSQVDFKGVSSRCDIIVCTKSGRLINLSIKKSLRERYKLSAFEQYGLRILYGNKCRTIIVTPESKESTNLKKKITERKDLSKTLYGVVYPENLIHLLNKMNIVQPDINDKRIVKYHKKRSNFLAAKKRKRPAWLNWLK